jgi:hypothetical protein
MKWLILLALISCGKHDEPKTMDLRDSDGDQVLNYAEEDLDKYVANYESLENIKGVLRFTLNEIIEIPVSNNVDLGKEALDLLAKNEKRVPNRDHFSEWSNLRLNTDKKFAEPKRALYVVSLQFENGSGIADELILKSQDTVLNLGKWSTDMSLQISGENLRKILCGEARLALRKRPKKSEIFNEDQSTSIKEKTYRVYVNDGKKSKILYVSKDLPFLDLQKMLRVSAHSMTNEDEIFFNSHLPEETRWFAREFENGQKVLAYVSRKELRQHFLNNYQYQKVIITRENGIPKTSLKFNNVRDAKVFLRINSIIQTQRTFEETKQIKRYGHGGGGYEGTGLEVYECTHYMRSVKSETSAKPSLDTVFENVDSAFFEGEEIFERLLQDRVFWEMKLNVLPENSELILLPRLALTYVVTGEYKNSCPDSITTRNRNASFKTNTEGKLSFEVESFVEKLQETAYN